MKTHKSHMDNTEIDKFIEIVCMCHDFGKGTTYFQKYLDGEYSITDAKYLYDTAERIKSTDGPSTEIYDLSGDMLYSDYVDK